MKKINWQKLHNVPRDCFWANLPCVAEECDIFDGLKKLFSLPNNHITLPKSKDSLRVLDTNSAQNITISFHALFKTASHEQIKQLILRCDTSIINSTLIGALIKFLPQHKMQQLHKMNEEGVQLSNVEEFAACLGGIERLTPRLNCMNFKLVFNDLVKDLKPDLKAGTAACEEIISNKKFGKILDLVLSIGNIMNGNSSKAIGFELSILGKLHDVKCTNNKQTLVNFIVETIQQKFPESLNFVDELVNIDKAAGLNFDHMNETIETIATSSQQLQEELKYEHASKLPEDKFVEVMAPFSLECRNQLKVLIKMMNEMRDSYAEVGRYFAFDTSKCSMEDWFSHIKTFKTQFARAYKEINKESKEKACRTQNSKLVDKQQKEPSFARAGIFMLQHHFTLCYFE